MNVEFSRLRPGKGALSARSRPGLRGAAPPAGRRAPLQAAAPSPAGPQRDECSTRRPLWGPQTARRQANPAWKIRRWKARRLNEGAASSGGGEGAVGAAGRAGNVSRAPRAPPAPAHSSGPPGPRRPRPTLHRGGRAAVGCCDPRLISHLEFSFCGTGERNNSNQPAPAILSPRSNTALRSLLWQKKPFASPPPSEPIRLGI